jgi:hypothetical protein
MQQYHGTNFEEPFKLASASIVLAPQEVNLEKNSDLTIIFKTTEPTKIAMNFLRRSVFCMALMLGGLLAGCWSNPYAGRQGSPDFDHSTETLPYFIDVQSLAPPDSDGLSRNSFSFNLKTTVEQKEVVLPFHFDTGTYSHITVRSPSLSAIGCSKQPEIAKWAEFDSAGKPLHASTAFSFNTGPKPEETNSDIDYNQDKAIEPQTEANFTLVFWVRSNCTQLNGEFAVQFR